MSKNLTDSDKRAVDLVLDQAGRSKAVPGFGEKPGDDMKERIAAVTKLLSLLGQMPAPEVPQGLADRTLDTVKKGVHGPVRPGDTARPSTGEQRPS